MTPSADKLAQTREAARGVVVTSVTPFRTDTLVLDEAGARANMALLAESKVAAVIPAGNTGEFHSLTRDEIVRMTRITIAGVAPHQAAMVGVGGELGYAIELAKMAEQEGAASILIHEPSHTFTSPTGLERYYRAISAEVSIGIAIYKRSTRLPDDVLLSLARSCDNIVAIKYAVNDIPAYVALVEAVGDDAVCACGTAERWALPFAISGTTGFTSGIANFAPDAVTGYWEMLSTAPTAPTTRRCWQTFAAIEEMRAREGAAMNVPVIKRAMELHGLAAGPPRPPLAAVTDAETAELRDLLAPLAGTEPLRKVG